MKIITPALLGAALLLAACGGEDTTTDDTTDTEAITADDTASEAAATAEDADESTANGSTAESRAADDTTASSIADDTDGSEGTATAAGGFSLYDFRYCEILMTVVGDEGVEVTEVWGTPGVDPCTDEAWYVLDPDAIQTENEASFIEMNGPRYFIVDGTAETGDGTGGTGTAAGGAAVSRQFGDITMTLLATTDVSEASEEYAPDLVARTTTWTYAAGTEVYELTDPEGNVYTMQSYSRIVDTDLTAADLPTLGDQLELPDGWSYSSRILDEPLQVELSPEGAIVIQDDLRNSYQRNG